MFVAENVVREADASVMLAVTAGVPVALEPSSGNKMRGDIHVIRLYQGKFILWNRCTNNSGVSPPGVTLRHKGDGDTPYAPSGAQKRLVLFL